MGLDGPGRLDPFGALGRRGALVAAADRRRQPRRPRLGRGCFCCNGFLFISSERRCDLSVVGGGNCRCLDAMVGFGQGRGRALPLQARSPRRERRGRRFRRRR